LFITILQARVRRVDCPFQFHYISYKQWTIMSSIYLDWAATAPPDREIQEQIRNIATEVYANPSAVHGPGRAAGEHLGQYRQRMADLLRCRPREVVFTSGATESNNMVLFSLLQKKRDRRILISGIEHPSVYEPALVLKQLGFQVVAVPADSSGRIDPNTVTAALDERTVLVAVMLVNNETGRIQPIREIAAAVEDYRRRTGKKILLHTDAVQAFGKIPFEPHRLGVDSAALSAHKIGGPRGCGALFVREGWLQQVLYRGGGQEGGMRPGTENLPGIYGFLLAAEKAMGAMEENRSQAQAAMESLIEELARVPEAVVIPTGRSAADGAEYSPYILSLSIPPIPGEVLVRVLEEEGFIVSTGAACSSKKQDRHRVLENMGISRHTASSALRISTGPGIGCKELEALAAALRRRVPELLNTARG
jgi:cysteine desulfurase